MIIGRVTPEPRDALARRAQAIRDDPTSAKYADAIAHTEVVKGMDAGTLTPEWTTANLVHDDPAKTLSRQDVSELLPEAGGGLRAAREVTRPDLAVLRARRSRNQSLVGVGQAGSAGARADQLAGLHRREVGPLRLRQASQGAAARRRATVRAQARRECHRAPGRRDRSRLEGRAARQDLHGRWPGHLGASGSRRTPRPPWSGTRRSPPTPSGPQAEAILEELLAREGFEEERIGPRRYPDRAATPALDEALPVREPILAALWWMLLGRLRWLRRAFVRD